MADTTHDRIAAMACPVDHTILDPAVQTDPWDFYGELHAMCPVFPIPEIGGVMVTKYDDVKYVLLHPELFASGGRSGGTRKGLQVDRSKRYQQILREKGWAHVETLQRTDPPLHSHYRRLVNKAFVPRRIRDMTEHIDEVTDELLTACLASSAKAHGGTVDVEFVDRFAMPLPGIIIAEQLGLDRNDIHRFKLWADAMLALAMRPVPDDELVAVAEIELEAQHHLAAIFENRRTTPQNDLMSSLVHAHENDDGPDDEPLTMHELQNLMHQLVTGGFETTTNALNHGMWLLTRYPEVQQRVRNDLSLLPAFIDEVLRFESPVQGLVRRATEDVDLGGVTIPEGALVMVRYGAANRDDEFFHDADTFDIDRPATAQHLAFGAGPHYCVGVALARQELTSGFTQWLERTGNIELGFDGVEHEPSFMLLPMAKLHLRVTPA